MTPANTLSSHFEKENDLRGKKGLKSPTKCWYQRGLKKKEKKKKKRIIWKEKTKYWNSLLKLHTYQQGLKVNTTIKTILLPKSSQNNTIR